MTYYTQSTPNILDVAEHVDLWFKAAEKYNNSHGEPLDILRTVQFFLFLRTANQLSHGDYLELGVHKGFSLAAIHRFMDPTKKLFALDTFTGFRQSDVDVDKRLFPDNPWGRMDFDETSPEDVAAYVGNGTPPDNLEIIKGWFPDAFEPIKDRLWRFVQIDFDLYQPCLDALSAVWPNMVGGGYVLVHDYGCIGFPGPRQAVDDFCSQMCIWPIELADRWGTAVLRKP